MGVIDSRWVQAWWLVWFMVLQRMSCCDVRIAYLLIFEAEVCVYVCARMCARMRKERDPADNNRLTLFGCLALVCSAFVCALGPVCAFVWVRREQLYFVLMNWGIWFASMGTYFNWDSRFVCAYVSGPCL